MPGRTPRRCRWRSRRITASAATTTWRGCGRRSQRELPYLSAFFQSGGMVDAVLNQGLPAPIDVQLSGSNVEAAFEAASEVAADIRKLPGVSDVYIPQDIDYPSLRLDIDRERAGELGLDQREVVNNVITALTSNQMIAPSYWVDPKSGNDYMLTVQYPENQIRNLLDLRGIPLHSGRLKDPTQLDAVTRITPLQVADRDRSLPDSAGHRHLRQPRRRGSRPSGRRHPRRPGRDASCRPASRRDPRHGAGHAGVVPQLRRRPDPRAGPAVPDPGRAVPVGHRPAADPAGGAAGRHRRAAGAAI